MIQSSVAQPVCRSTLVCHHNVSGVPRIFIRNCIFVRYSYKKAISYISSSIVYSNMCNVLLPYACILIGQVFIYVDTYLLSCIVSYLLFVRRHFVVCRHVSLINQGVLRVKKRLRNTDIECSSNNCSAGKLLYNPKIRHNSYKAPSN
jgi:hypothetical protein